MIYIYIYISKSTGRVSEEKNTLYIYPIYPIYPKTSGHEFPLQIFNLEQFDEEDSSRRVVAKFGAYQYHLVKNLYNHLDSQLFEEKHGVQSQRNLESQTNALKQSQRLNLDINVNGNGNENGSSHGSPSSVSRGAVTGTQIYHIYILT